MSLYTVTYNNTTHEVHPLSGYITAELNQLMEISLELPWHAGKDITLPATMYVEGIKSKIEKVIERYPVCTIIGHGLKGKELRNTRINLTSQAPTVQSWISAIASSISCSSTFGEGTTGLTDNPKTGNLASTTIYNAIQTITKCYGKSVHHYNNGNSDVLAIHGVPSTISYQINNDFQYTKSAREEYYNEAVLQKVSSATSTSTTLLHEGGNTNSVPGASVTMQGFPYLEGTYTAKTGKPTAEVIRSYFPSYKYKYDWDEENHIGGYYLEGVDGFELAPFCEFRKIGSTVNDHGWKHKTFIRWGVQSGADVYHLCGNRFVKSNSASDWTHTDVDTREYYLTSQLVPHSDTGVLMRIDNDGTISDTQYPQIPTVSSGGVNSELTRIYTYEYNQAADLVALRYDSHYGPYYDNYRWEVVENPHRDYTNTTTRLLVYDSAGVVHPQTCPWAHLTRSVTYGADVTHTYNNSTPYHETESPMAVYNIHYIQGESTTYSRTKVTGLEDWYRVTDTHASSINISDAQFCAGFDPSSIPTIFPGSTFPTMPQSSETFFDPTVSSDDVNTRYMGLGVVGSYTYKLGQSHYPIELQPTSVHATVTAHAGRGYGTQVMTVDNDFDLTLLGTSTIPKRVTICETDDVTWTVGTSQPKAYVVTSSMWGSKSTAEQVQSSVLWYAQRGTLCNTLAPITGSLVDILASVGKRAVCHNRQGQIQYVRIDLLQRTAEYELREI